MFSSHSVRTDGSMQTTRRAPMILPMKHVYSIIFVSLYISIEMHLQSAEKKGTEAVATRSSQKQSCLLLFGFWNFGLLPKFSRESLKCF